MSFGLGPVFLEKFPKNTGPKAFVNSLKFKQSMLIRQILTTIKFSCSSSENEIKCYNEKEHFLQFEITLLFMFQSNVQFMCSK